MQCNKTIMKSGIKLRAYIYLYIYLCISLTTSTMKKGTLYGDTGAGSPHNCACNATQCSADAPPQNPEQKHSSSTYTEVDCHAEERIMKEEFRKQNEAEMFRLRPSKRLCSMHACTPLFSLLLPSSCFHYHSLPYI